MLRTTLLPVLASLVLFACGGAVEKVPDPNGSSSPTNPSGSAGAGSGATGSSSSSGGASKSTSESGGEAQCDGIPECNDGWTEVKGCVPDSECEKLTTCGISIICQKIDPTCEGPKPICDPGDEEIEGKNACPADAKCYSRSNNCNFTIWCASK